MTRTILLLLGLIGLLVLAFCSGCERAPKNLGPDFHKGKCAVCSRSTQVTKRVMNPMNGYGVEVCWREDCQRKLRANMADYIDTKAMNAPAQGQQPAPYMNVPAPR